VSTETVINMDIIEARNNLDRLVFWSDLEESSFANLQTNLHLKKFRHDFIQMQKDSVKFQESSNKDSTQKDLSDAKKELEKV